MRVRRVPKERAALSDAIRYLLLTGRCPEKGQFSSFWDAVLLSEEETVRLWVLHRAALLAEWESEHPGTRPPGARRWGRPAGAAGRATPAGEEA